MKWSEDDINKLRTMLSEGAASEKISKALNRTERAIRSKRERLNIEIVKQNKINNANVLCPFFIRYRDKCIVCEGFDADSVLSTIFRDQQKLVEYAQKYCQNNWEDCEIATALWNVNIKEQE